VGRARNGRRPHGLPVEVLSKLLRWPAVERLWLPEWLADPDAVADRLAAACNTTAAVPGPVEPVISRSSEHGQSPTTKSTATERDHARLTDSTSAAGYADVVDAEPATIRSVSNEALPESVQRVRSDSPNGHRLAGDVDFVAWTPEVIGTRDTLDRLRSGNDRDVVLRLIRAAVNQEGPIHRERLARAVAGALGLNRLSPARLADIVTLIPPTIATDEGGLFVWPDDRKPGEWNSFRRSEDYASRPVEDIALREIGNAMVSLCAAAGGMPPDELLREALKVFGGKRLTTAIAARLTAALDLAVAQGGLKNQGDFVR